MKNEVKDKVKTGRLRAMVRWNGFMRKLEAKMTPGWELLLTIFFGWTGIRWWIRGRIWVGLRMFLTLGLFGIGWIIDIITCTMNYLKYCEIEENAKKGIINCVTVIDEKYGGSLGEKNCVYYCDGLRWLGDIDTVEMHNTAKYCNDILDTYPILVDTDECYRLKLYILLDRVVSTNVAGVEFEYGYDMIESIDIYSDVFNIKGKDRYIYTVRLSEGDGVKIKLALDNIMLRNKVKKGV